MRTTTTNESENTNNQGNSRNEDDNNSNSNMNNNSNSCDNVCLPVLSPASQALAPLQYQQQYQRQQHHNTNKRAVAIKTVITQVIILYSSFLFGCEINFIVLATSDLIAF